MQYACHVLVIKIEYSVNYRMKSKITKTYSAMSDICDLNMFHENISKAEIP